MRIFVGMDLGSKSVAYCVMDERGRVLDRSKMGWEVEEWKRVLGRYGRELVEVAFETGPEGYRAKGLLEGLGIEMYPFHAASFPKVSRSKRKTDRLDAERICQGLKAGGLPERVKLAGKEEERLRNLIGEWELRIKTIQMQVNRVRSMSRCRGVELPEWNRGKAEEWWERVIGLFDEADRGSVKRSYRTVLSELQGLEELEEEIREQVKRSGHGGREELLESVPGIGPVTSRAVVAYLGDGKRFKNGRKFAAYSGMTPTVDQTGIRKAQLGHITRQGPAVLRRLFVQAAQSASRSNTLRRTRWWKWFERLQARRGRKIAIVALARKLAEACYAIVRDGTKWNEERLWPTVA
jgi:transposase